MFLIMMVNYSKINPFSASNNKDTVKFKKVPELIKKIPELIKKIPELIKKIPELIKKIPELLLML